MGIGQKALNELQTEKRDEEEFLKVDPESASGRKAISDELKTEIVKL